MHAAGHHLRRHCQPRQACFWQHFAARMLIDPFDCALHSCKPTCAAQNRPCHAVSERCRAVSEICRTVSDTYHIVSDTCQAPDSSLHFAGQWALEQAGLFEKWKTLVRPEGQDMRILDKEGAVLWEEVESTQMDRPEVCAPPGYFLYACCCFCIFCQVSFHAPAIL